MTEPSSKSAWRLDSLGDDDSEEAIDHECPFTGFRPSSLTTFGGQRLDSARYVEPCRPMRDASNMPATGEILAATAHELRLPLSHIKGFVTSLRRSDVEWDDDARKEFLAEIELETDRLAEVVESLLAAPAPDSGYKPEIKLVCIQPASIAEGALHRVRGLFGDRLLRLDVPPTMPSVRADPSQMERVLANLIQNAIKYSPASTAIGISARITEDRELVLSVEDEGPGIAAEDRERIFEPFVRKHTAEQSGVPGHGLGLAICQSIVLAHGGRIEVDERPGGGARFSVFLPAPVRARQVDCNYQPKEQANDPATDSAKNSGSGRRGADAQAPHQQPHRQRLRVQSVAGGVEALKLIEEHPFDLLLLDINMPGPNGLQVLEAVRREVGIAVLMLSGRGRERDKVEALDLGADDYLTKPFGVAELLARVKALLRRVTSGTRGRLPPYRHQGLEVDFAARRARVDGVEAPLTRREFEGWPILREMRARCYCIGRCCKRYGADSTETNPTTYGPLFSGSAARSNRTALTHATC